MWPSKKRRSSRRRRSSLLRSGKAIRGFMRGLVLELMGAALIIFLFMMIRIRPIEQQERMDARNEETPMTRDESQRMASPNSAREIFR